MRVQIEKAINGYILHYTFDAAPRDPKDWPAMVFADKDSLKNELGRLLERWYIGTP